MSLDKKSPYSLKYTEMNQEQLDQFSDNWIANHATMLQVECGESKEDSLLRAEVAYEHWVGCGGHDGRDEWVQYKRDYEENPANAGDAYFAPHRMPQEN